MTKTLTAAYDTYEKASITVLALETAGYDHDHITIVTNLPGSHGHENDAPEHTADVDAEEKGMALRQGGAGALAGGAVGLLGALGVIAIPGIGPVLAAGWLTATFIGAAFGSAAGLTSALVEARAMDKHAQAYVDAVSTGATLVVVRCDVTQVAEVEAILKADATPNLPIEHV